MAKKKSEPIPFYLAGLILLLPCLIISILNYIRIRIKFGGGQDTRRIADIRRMLKPIVFGCTMLAVAFFAFTATMHTNPAGASAPISPHFELAVRLGMLCLSLFILCIVGMNLSVMYMGVIVNKQKNIVAFSHDMQSYGFLDYVFLKFIVDFARVATVPLLSIEKISRGKGKELYLHGPFGSRCIRMSNKQKRDECLLAIQNNLKKGSIMTEMESY